MSDAITINNEVVRVLMLKNKSGRVQFLKNEIIRVPETPPEPRDAPP